MTAHRARRVLVDVQALYRALDAARAAGDVTWRALADEVGVSASTLSRMANGQTPDVHAYMSLCRWLRLPAEQFTVTPEDEAPAVPPLPAHLRVVLNQRGDLSPSDVDHLVELATAFDRWRTRSIDRSRA